jgi:hypothetical protein
MLSRNYSVAPALILMLGLITTTAAARAGVHERTHQSAPGAYSLAAPQPRYHTLRDLAQRSGYAAPVPSPVYLGPGYVFVPGRGILGEDCDMPTSTCPNELRDIN